MAKRSAISSDAQSPEDLQHAQSKHGADAAQPVVIESQPVATYYVSNDDDAKATSAGTEVKLAPETRALIHESSAQSNETDSGESSSLSVETGSKRRSTWVRFRLNSRSLLRPLLVQPKVRSYRGARLFRFRHGFGKAKHSKNLEFEGHWFLGFWSGHGTLKFNREWTYTGNFSRGMINGKGKLALANGITLEGRFRKSIPRGRFELRFADGSLFKGRWKVQRRKRAWQEGLRATGTFRKPGSLPKSARIENRVTCLTYGGRESVEDGVVVVRDRVVFSRWRRMKRFYFPDVLKGLVSAGTAEL